ncbi:hypothetical protein CCAX7_62210 [Capsulimonas corticalis]|uniref:Uncharacterized protein n=1 Tax=Capsulimonas corticalis TaxID=2219043 RepID=A0A402CWI8_9BACT|nr:replication-relaxation family protein [Capsulimonas corticalis]BDI34170.1 hypothetical protein CCAX7_62210 [Capsulimonas corticalis]
MTVTDHPGDGDRVAALPRSRFVASPKRRLALGPRDREMLVDLYHHQAMLRGQIQALYFVSVARCNDRLRQLFDHGYVQRYFHPASPYGAQAIYTVGRNAAPVIAAALGTDAAEVRRRCRARTPAFLEHTLEIVRFYLAVRAATQGPEQAQIELWLPEARCRHEYEMAAAGAANRWRKEVFKPDGFIRLDAGDKGYRSYFLEIDLGHTSSRQFRNKLADHERYLRSGLFEERFGCSEFRTLVVTTGARRLSNLLSLVRKEAEDLAWFTTFEELEEHGALGAIWRSARSPCARSLVSDGQTEEAACGSA